MQHARNKLQHFCNGEKDIDIEKEIEYICVCLVIVNNY